MKFLLLALLSACVVDPMPLGEERPKTGIVEVALEGEPYHEAHAVIADADGRLVQSAPLGSGDVRAFERTGVSSVLLVRSVTTGAATTCGGSRV